MGPQDKALVAMSGGVDSSVAAALLQDAGYEVTGVFMCLGYAEESGNESRTCCSPKDAADAQEVGQILGIEVIVLSVSYAFEPIINNFVEEYARGRTPNPCVHCNTRIKFGRLFDLADSLGSRYVATGHYARVASGDGQPAIERAKARDKDQSYALFGIERRRLDRILMPVGEFENKMHVRETAWRMGLPVHEKPDSQEVCFLSDEDYVSLLERSKPEALRSGKIVDSAGNVIGRHDGYARFTIGQRRGLGIAAGRPIYVTQIDPVTATVSAGPREELLTRRLRASHANWHNDVPEEFDATVQVRYNHRGTQGRVRTDVEGTFEVEFLEPVSAVAPGQAAVVYTGSRLLGGGWIETNR